MPKPDQPLSGDGPSRPARRALGFRRFAPWLVAAVILAWIFHIVPLADLEEALRNASLPAFVPVMIFYVLGALLADTLATSVALRVTLPGSALTYPQLLTIRGASYLLSLVNYGVGQGGIAYFLHRRYQVPLPRAVGTVMLTTGVNILLIAASAMLGIVLGGAPADPPLRALVVGLSATLPVYLAVIAARPGFLVRRAFLAPLFEAGVRGHLVVAGARLPHIGTLLLGHFFAMRAFGVAPPLTQALTLLPLVFVVGSLPISPAGLGTAQAVAIGLFAPFAEGSLAERQAAVLAYSLATNFAGVLLQAVIGFAFLPRLAAGGNVEPPPGS